jgi:hypothetical protein
MLTHAVAEMQCMQMLANPAHACDLIRSSKLAGPKGLLGRTPVSMPERCCCSHPYQTCSCHTEASGVPGLAGGSGRQAGHLVVS